MTFHNDGSDQDQTGKTGNGFRLNSSKFSIDELLLIARAAVNGEATVVLTGASALTSDDLMRIDEIGKGCVLLEP